MIGNSAANLLLENLIKREKTHAVLLIGPKNVGKRTAILENIFKIYKPSKSALELDILIIPYAKKPHGVVQARQIKHFFTSRPVYLPHKIIILEEADQLTKEAANILLITVESPPGHGLIFLTATNPNGVLPTLRSRCVVVNFSRVSDEEIKRKISTRNLSPVEQATAIKRAQGCPGVALRLTLDKHELKMAQDLLTDVKNWQTGDLFTRFKIIKKRGNDTNFAKAFIVALGPSTANNHKKDLLIAEKRLAHNVQPQVVLEALAMLTSKV